MQAPFPSPVSKGTEPRKRHRASDGDSEENRHSKRAKTLTLDPSLQTPTPFFSPWRDARGYPVDMDNIHFHTPEQPAASQAKRHSRGEPVARIYKRDRGMRGTLDFVC
jgi:hypothetical protein